MVRRAQTQQDLESVFAIRHQVFIEEQGVPIEEERDSYDLEAWHWLAWNQGMPIATARLVRIRPDQGKVGRVAVLPSARGGGVGRQLMFAIHDAAQEEGIVQLFLDAQLTVIPFYEALGYETQGEVFEDCGILHRRMTRWRA